MKKEDNVKYIPDADGVEYFIKKKLDIMFYKIPSTRIVSKREDRFEIEINMSPEDYKSCMLTGGTIKKWLKQEFDLTGFKVSATSFRHPHLTLGYTEYSIVFEKEAA